MLLTCNFIFVSSLFVFRPPNNTIMLITVRFFIGLTQATLSVFCPVWVDRFATKGNQAKWFSLLQITVPLGIMVGYLMGWGANGLQSESEGKECWGDSFACWRLPFIVQGIITIPLCMAFLLIKHEDLDIGHHNADQDENNKCCSDNDSNHHHNNVGCCNFVKQYFRDLYTIITQFYFTSVVIVITTMYFVLVTIQYWATAWMIVGRSYPEDAVMGWFIFCSATGPTIGAIVGGWLIDYLGGYVGSMEQRRFSTGILFFIYTIGTCFGLGATNWIGGGLTWVVICLWVVLFCGGMVVPALTGMYTAAIPTARLKILGSSLMLVTISVFAYFLCPVVAGHLMKSFSKSIPECIGTVPGTCPAALEKGFRWSMNMSPVSLILLLVVWVGGCFLKGDRLVDTVDQRVVKLNNAEDKRVVKLSNNNVEANSSDNLFQLGEDRKVEEEKKNRIEILSKTD